MRRHSLLFIGLSVLGALTFSGFAGAWIVKYWSVSELLDASTLVVVATPVSNKVLTAKKIAPHLNSGERADPNVYVDDVATAFKVSFIVKGSAEGDVIVLHHQRFTDGRGPMFPGPGLMDFTPGSGIRYLMFLTREPNGYAVAASGPLDTGFAVVSVSP